MRLAVGKSGFLKEGLPNDLKELAVMSDLAPAIREHEFALLGRPPFDLSLQVHGLDVARSAAARSGGHPHPTGVVILQVGPRFGLPSPTKSAAHGSGHASSRYRS